MKKLFISIIILAVLCTAYPSNTQGSYTKMLNLDFVGIWCNGTTWISFENEKEDYTFSTGEGRSKNVVSGMWFATKDTNFVALLFSDGSELRGFYKLEGETLELELYNSGFVVIKEFKKCEKKPYRPEDTI